MKKLSTDLGTNTKHYCCCFFPVTEIVKRSGEGNLSNDLIIMLDPLDNSETDFLYNKFHLALKRENLKR